MAITQVSNSLVKQDLTIVGGSVDNTVIGSGTPAAGTFTTVAGSLASTVTGTTAAASDNSTKIATTAYVTTALANLVDSAPGTLNTLNELAAALGDDASFSTTVTTSIAAKLPLAGGTMTGALIVDAGNSGLDIRLGTDKRVSWSGGIGEIGSTAGFQALNTAGSALAGFGIRASELKFATGSATRLTIDSSGNVGIGTSSQSSYYAKNLVVMADGDGTGGITIAAPATDDNTYLAFADGTSGAAAYAGYVGYSHSSEYLFLGAGGETTMYVQGKTRVGIGGAPNANWRNDATDKVLTLGTEAAVHSDAGVTTELWNNAYVNNSDTFKNISTRGASRYMQYSGAHKWFTAASASAGSTISTEINSTPKMVLDISGNLGIGTSSAGTFRTKIKHSAASVTTGLGIEASANGSVLRVFHSGSLAGFNATYSGSGAYVPMVFNVGAGGEAMRLGTDGNVGIADTPPSWGAAYAGLAVGSAGSIWGSKAGASLVVIGDNSFHNGSGYVARNTGASSQLYQNAGALVFENAASVSAGASISLQTRFMVDSSGNLLINGATSNAKLSVKGASNLRAQNVQVAVDGHTAIGFFNASGTDVGGIAINASGASISLGGNAAANTLDDYEEGTWNPSLIAGTTNPTGGSNLAPSGTYTKIGNRVWVTFYVGRSWTNSPSGTVYLGNLPFSVHSTSPNYYSANVVTYKVDFGNANIPFLIPTGGSNSAALYTAASGGTWSALTWQTHMTSSAGSYISGTLHYVVA